MYLNHASKMINKIEDPNTKISRYFCDTWDDFIKCQRTIVGRYFNGYFYRGHRNIEWKLSSPLERQFNLMRGSNKKRSVYEFINKENYIRARSGNIDLFKDLSTGLPNFDATSMSESEWLGLARHQGVHLDILDWSRSPYIAAFFAFIDAIKAANESYGHQLGQISSHPTVLPNDPVAIWAIANDREIEHEGEFIFITENRSQKNFWQKSQQGIFTRLFHDVFLDIESYFVERSIGSMLEYYQIPGNEAAKALSDLNRMNIRYSTLFPDLRGAALDSNLVQFYHGMDFIASH